MRIGFTALVTTNQNTSSKTAAENHAALVEAFHAVYDAKDKLPAGSHAAYFAYEAIGKIADLLVVLGYDRPSRFDGQGR